MKYDRTLIIFKTKQEHFWFSCNIIEEHIDNSLSELSLTKKIIFVDEHGSLASEDFIWLQSKINEPIAFLFLGDNYPQENLVESLTHSLFF